MIVSGTGHRPNKLGGYSDENLERLKNIALNYLKDKKVEKVISGMALGWDTALALAALELEIPLECAVPFEGQESKWVKKSRDLYNDILSKADEVTYVCDGGYAAWKMQVRNKYMVDNSDLLLAMFNGTSGGTKNCVDYANETKTEVVNLYKEDKDIFEEDFKEWFNSWTPFKFDSSLYGAVFGEYNSNFEGLPIEMKYGVYLAFFDDKDIDIKVDVSFLDWAYAVNPFNKHKGGFKTRLEAIKAGIEHAKKLYNEHN